jgi:hypothetical protein
MSSTTSRSIIVAITGIDANGEVAESFRAQAVQGPELTR